jgi:DNA-binding transcriptional MocR family regulator
VRNPKISAGAKLAYGRLVRYAGQDGDCHPSVKTLANEIGLGERQTQRYLGELERNGFIRSSARFRGANIRDTNGYFFLWHETFVGSMRNSATPVSNVTPARVSQKTPTLVPDVTPQKSHGEESPIEESQSSSNAVRNVSASDFHFGFAISGANSPPDSKLTSGCRTIQDLSRTAAG